MKIKANKVLGWDECKNPGDWFFAKEHKAILFMCPSGCGQMRSILIGPLDNHPYWIWDGNEDNPTLTPSIQVVLECRWHGFLRNGEWVNA